MRIVSWNVYRGECRERASDLAALGADITVLQECGQPTAPEDEHCQWFGSIPIQGVGVLTRAPWTVKRLPQSPLVQDSAYLARVQGPVPLNILAVWTKPRPTYVLSLIEALNVYRDRLLDGPTIVVGDFNSHWVWDARSATANHSHLVKLLHDEFGLVSAYHSHDTGCEPGKEQPTLYWQWKENQPFHVDYCFLPKVWLPCVRSVEVGSFADWEGKSDHRPLVVDIDHGGLPGPWRTLEPSA